MIASEPDLSEDGRDGASRSISTLRKHIYFYLLLILATIAGHNVWRAMNADDSPPTASGEISSMKQLADNAQHLYP